VTTVERGYTRAVAEEDYVAAAAFRDQGAGLKVTPRPLILNRWHSNVDPGPWALDPQPSTLNP